MRRNLLCRSRDAFKVRMFSLSLLEMCKLIRLMWYLREAALTVSELLPKPRLRLAASFR